MTYNLKFKEYLMRGFQSLLGVMISISFILNILLGDLLFL